MIKQIIKYIANNAGLRKAIPAGLKNSVRGFLPMDKYNQLLWEKLNPHVGTPYEWGFDFGSKYTLGILFDIKHEHHNYISACIDMKISYKVFNIWSNDWISAIKQTPCDAYLVWPNIQSAIVKQFWDERLFTLTEELQGKIYPSFNELWLYESKRRSRDFMITHNLPHPKTWVFFNREEALDFAKNTELPVVFKTDQGASAKGVVICRERSQVYDLVNTSFSKGFVIKRGDKNDRHRGYCIFQAYLPDCEEWRLIRVNESYFCRYKIKVGDFHSGSGEIVWATPPEELLFDIKRITDAFGFQSMNIDYFKTNDGRYLINELHTVFGGKVLPNDELCGRYTYNQATGTFDFEKGEFFQYRCGLRRVEHVIEKLNKNIW